MYVYFDVNGNLKEIINNPIREGDDNVDSIYIYMEPSIKELTTIPANQYENYDFEDEVPTLNEIKVFMLPTIYNVWEASFRYTDGEIITEPGHLLGDDIEDSNVIKQIPFDKERDLKYFKYYQYYQFIKIDITSELTIEDGRVDCSVSMINTSLEEDEEGYIKFLDIISFFIQDSVVVKDVQISTAQYEYLYAQIQMLKGSDDYVPYTGAIRNVNLGINGITAGFYDTEINDDGINYHIDEDGIAYVANGQPIKLVEFPEAVGGNEVLATQPYISTTPPDEAGNKRVWFDISGNESTVSSLSFGNNGSTQLNFNGRPTPLAFGNREGE